MPGVDLTPPSHRPTSDDEDLTDDDRSMDQRNICARLAQDTPRSMAA